MIAAIVLREFRCRARRAARFLRVKTRVRLRRLPWRFHVRGVLLPPWPNYGASRLGTKPVASRPRR
jgi:hypothetical protein